jgi:serpin B
VEDKTENKIKDLIPAGAIDPLTRLVITNAVYFNGKWEKPFDENRTHDDEFRIAPGKTVRVRMMTDERYFGYTETDIFQVLDMPYNHTGGKELSLLVILPRGDNLTVAENSLGSQKLSDIRKSLAFQRVMVYFPKFRLETEYRLPATLKAMGMPTAFSGSADFSGMDGTHNLFISDVIHKAFVDVGEEGTEAAAATAVIIVAVAAPVQKPAPVPVFRADHPFIFLIQDKETGNILFVGRVMNPAGS